MKDGQTIGEWLKWDFDANGSLKINDKNGKIIYWEDSNGYWTKREYNSEGLCDYYENSDGEINYNGIPAIIEIIIHKGRKYKLIP